jgi:hypothetical protein
MLELLTAFCAAILEPYLCVAREMWARVSKLNI